MNSEKTQIARKGLSAPMRVILDKYGPLLKGKRILHFGEGKAYEDTLALTTLGPCLAYDPHSKFEYSRDEGLLDFEYDLIVSNYVFNTLPPVERQEAFNKIKHTPCIITVRADRANGSVFADGVVTSRGTFQKQYTPQEAAREFGGYVLESNSSYVMVLTPGS